jgi:hypothetical protein
MTTQSRRALVQMTVVLVIAVAVAVIIGVARMEGVKAIFFTDWRTIALNGGIVLLFALGIGRLYQGLMHYAREEEGISRFIGLKQEGVATEVIFAGRSEGSIIAKRYATIRDLYARGAPINHSAISAIMVAEESLYQSFPRFVNNVLILTGVFGTVTSLIIALVGASNVLQAALPGEGMGMMLQGMNTALTTTATAIVCFFFFTYFYHKLTDVQTYLFSQVERAVLLHLIPEFAFETEAVNHQTSLLIKDVQGLVKELEQGLADLGRTLTGLNDHNAVRQRQGDEVLAGQEQQQARLDGVLSRLDEVRRVLVEGFRLRS